MTQTEIISKIKDMKTAGNLAELLDLIKQKEFVSVRYDITENMLRHFSSDKLAPKRFRTFHIRKKSGGRREIKAPCRQLDKILTCVNILLKAVYEPSDAAMGFTAGRSVIQNAQVHVGHNYVLNLDLKDFFTSIPQARVWKRLQLPPFNFPVEIANILAGLCCTFDEDVKTNVLPQGSPASPLLTNAICDKLDRRLKGVAKRFGLHYSRYADDITFSSMHNVYQEGSEFRTEVERIISDQGFTLNPAKTRLLKKGRRQEVTGLTVNAFANVPRKYISDLRWIINLWEKEGYAKAYARFYLSYKSDKNNSRKGEPILENVIGGKLNYLRMVRGENNAAYRKLQARYSALQSLRYAGAKKGDGDTILYVLPYSVPEFEELFGTKISLEISREGKVVGVCELGNYRLYISISRSTQGELCPDLSLKTKGDVIESELLDMCHVTLCRKKGKNFWLLTLFEPTRSHLLSIQDLKVSPDDLLDYWEENGVEATAEKFRLFIQSDKRDNTIKNWEQFIGSGSLSTGKGFVKSGQQQLLGFFLKNKTLSASQRNKFMELLDTIHYVSTNSNKHSENIVGPIEQNAKYNVKFNEMRIAHDPATTARFLSLLTNPNGLKFLIHDFDPEINITIQDMISNALEILVSYRLLSINHSLLNLISGFVNGPKWIDYKNNSHKFHLNSETIKLWEDMYPQIHPSISNKFCHEFQKFRNTLWISKPQLLKILNYIVNKNKFLHELKIETVKLDKADFYTNVFVLVKYILNSVLRDISRRDNNARVKVCYERSAWNEYRLCSIRVTHLGSVADSLFVVKERIRNKGGAMFNLMSSCKGYCDWTIEAKFEDGAKRWRILNYRNLPEFENLDENQVEGFSHIFTFYKK